MNSYYRILNAQRAQRTLLNPQRAQSRTTDVFLSFRGEDVRKTFVASLNEALGAKGVNTFIDDMMPKGVTIRRGLVGGIEAAKISIPIISKDFVSSTWCLDELMHILECRERQNQLVLPVFYEVDPSEVRKQTQIFEQKFADLKFKNGTEKVRMWSQGLRKIGDLNGFHWKKDRKESEFIDEIAKHVANLLSQRMSVGERHDKVLRPTVQKNLASSSVAYVTEARKIRDRRSLNRINSKTLAHESVTGSSDTTEQVTAEQVIPRNKFLRAYPRCHNL
ncbi:TMV resistance protein N [Morella rubra]|uniref:ADP-ribosyl cyclase/cyclic ADP-ribose hydrolase n=1 Tax=Morella rubra TaxID=262757 RepID=A0A6A1VQG3_9ROSI|nr:TMV resistance protein N [Morella rubra]